MNVYDWLPIALFSGVLWLCRNLISTRLTRSVQHEFDAKLAALQSELRTKEESLKAEIRTGETAIFALQNTSLSAVASRRSVTDKRQIEAIDQLWEAMHQLGFAKAAAQWMSAIKFEAALKESARNPAFRKIFDIHKGPEDQGAAAFALANKARPHISELSWAYFSAWQAIVTHAFVQMKLLQVGLDAPNTIDSEGVTDLVIVALPHQAEFIKQHGAGAAYLLLPELETRLLKDLRQTLEGRSLDIAGVERASAIQQEAQRLSKETGPAIPKEFAR